METDLADTEFESLQLSQKPLYHGQDLLTCGECRCEFALADILKFIRHKMKHCRSRCNDSSYDGDETHNENGDNNVKLKTNACAADGNGEPEVRKQTPPIIAQRHKLKLQQAKQTLVTSAHRLRHETQRSPPRDVHHQHVDPSQTTNTINKGESN